MAVHFGYGIFTGQAPPQGSVAREYQTLLELAPHIEDAGFHSMWLSEHHFADDGYLPSVLPLLSAVAARTSQLKLGTSLILAPLHHPIRLAEDCAVVDLISGGRLIVGMGAGWRDEEFRAFGSQKATRGAWLEHLCPALRLSWAGERFSYTEGPLSLVNVRVRPTPGREIPLWLGGLARPALLRAGRLGDGFLASSTDAKTLSERVQIVDEGARLSGRPRMPRVGLMIDAWLGQLDDDVRHAYWCARGVYEQWRMGFDTPEMPYGLPPKPSEAEPPFSGEPDELSQSIADYVRAAGPGREVTVIARLYYPGLPVDRSREVLTRFGSEVIPAVREALGSAWTD